jgi:hypothetical protein
MRRRSDKVVAGLDLSLTCPAVVVIPSGWVLGDWPNLARARLITDPVNDDHARAMRIIKIVGFVRDFVLSQGATDWFVEDYAFSKRSSSVTKLAELGGHARAEFLTYGKPLRAVPASQARKLLLGKLPRKDAKLAVQNALYTHGAKFEDDNECDAFCVANFGLSEVGLPFLSLA